MANSHEEYSLLVPNQAPDTWRALGPLPADPENSEEWPELDYTSNRTPDELATIHNNYFDFCNEWQETIAPVRSNYANDQLSALWDKHPVLGGAFSVSLGTGYGEYWLNICWNNHTPSEVENVLREHHPQEPDGISALGKIIGETIFGEKYKKYGPPNTDELRISVDTTINFNETGLLTQRDPAHSQISFPPAFTRHVYDFAPLNNTFEAQLTDSPDGTGEISRTEFFTIVRGILYLLDAGLRRK